MADRIAARRRSDSGPSQLTRHDGDVSHAANAALQRAAICSSVPRQPASRQSPMVKGLPQRPGRVTFRAGMPFVLCESAQVEARARGTGGGGRASFRRPHRA